jgi:putative (di)nucleoside polyphosphate hydrolase
MVAQHFRAGVVIVVRHADRRQVMAFERSDAPGSWQLPQGGLIDDEEPVEGAWRELLEETGLDDRHVVARAEFPEWVAYEWPKDYTGKPRAPKPGDAARGRRRGQVQKWFLFDVVSEDIEPAPDGTEFVAWKWVDPAWLVEHVIDWRRDAYRRVLTTL